jgi:hypothetical protein
MRLCAARLSSWPRPLLRHTLHPRTQQPTLPASATRSDRSARLVQIRDNLIARIAEARQHGWLGEVEGLQVSLHAARQKLEQVDQITSHRRSVPLGLPTYGATAGRTLTGETTLK